MEKVIWAYYNKKDLLQIEKLFSNNGAFFVDKEDRLCYNEENTVFSRPV